LTTHRRLRLFFIIALGFFSLVFFNSPALGQTGITVTPTNITSTIAPGDETREVIMLSNSSVKDIVVAVSIEQPDAEEGAASITVDREEVLLATGESADLELMIHVPDDASAGEQTAFVIIDVNGASQQDVAIVGNVQVSIGLNVIAPVSDVDFTFPRIVTSPNEVMFTMQGRNTSDFPTSFQGKVELDGLWGDDVVLQQESSAIDNDETFDLQVIWDDAPSIGIRKMTISLSSGVGAPVTKSGYIFFISWKVLIFTLALLIILPVIIRKSPAIANVFRR
jgi:hypothetical protein